MTDPIRKHCAEILDLWDADYDVDAAMEHLRGLLAQPEPEGVTDEQWDAIKDRLWDKYETVGYQNERFMSNDDFDTALDVARKDLTHFARPTIKPVPVAERLPGCAHERFEFSVFDSEYEEQAGGTAPTYAQALSEGQHYLAMYSQDGPHSLELRRVEVLIPDALPIPTTH